VGNTDLEDLMLNRWFEKTVHKDRLWPDQFLRSNFQI